MIRSAREATALCLIALLPFHAFLVTVGTKVLQGPGHAPLAALAVWKEALLCAVLLLGAIECVAAVRRPEARRAMFSVDGIDVLILSFIALGCIVSAVVGQNLATLAYGLKYDALPLVLFLCVRRLSWSQEFVERCVLTIFCTGGAAALLGLLSFALPESVFSFLGYSDLHSIYVANKPLAAFQHIGEQGARRMQSVMSGPNQLGIWLLLPLPLVGMMLVRRFARNGKSIMRIMTGFRGADGRTATEAAVFLFCAFALFFTFSRSAWIAAAIMTVVAAHKHLEKRTFHSFALRFAALLICGALLVTLLAPRIMLRISSSRGHLVRPLQAIAQMIDRPLGSGFGSAGPASHRHSDTCVHLRPQDDPSWAQDRPNLCVFLGAQQVQPLDRLCICPVLPENWYLQIGIETGVIGFVLYLSLIALLIMKLWKAKNEDVLAEAALLSFIGVSVAALTLHAWEDAAVAYTVWLLAGVTLSRLRRVPD